MVQLNRRKVMSFGICSLIIVSAYVFVSYRSYASAVAWHCIHGKYANVAGHTVRLPALWWRDADAAYGTALLSRACPSRDFPKAQIIVRPMNAAGVKGTDQEELEATQNLLADRKKSSRSNNSLSLVVIRAKSLNLYCQKEDQVVSEITLYSHLTCHAAGIPFSFAYSGMPNREAEAESVLATID